MLSILKLRGSGLVAVIEAERRQADLAENRVAERRQDWDRRQAGATERLTLVSPIPASIQPERHGW
jgi:hypothetical protein